MSSPAVPAPSHSRSTFISHSSQDAALAQELCSLLENKGVRCWIAPRDVAPGAPYAEEIVRGIQGCESIVLLATPTAVASDNVLNEVEQAHKRHKTIFTVMFGKPGITRQMDYYISRLHWIESADGSLPDVASRLSEVMNGRKDWAEVSSPPSLARRFTYTRPAFFGALAASLLVLVLAALAGWFYIAHRQHTIALDYLSLGWITLGNGNLEGDIPNSPHKVQLRVWLSDQQVPFSAVKLAAFTRAEQRNPLPVDLGKKPIGNATGKAIFSIQVPADARYITTCLTLPSAELHRDYTVQQSFIITSDHDTVSFQSTGQPKVTVAGSPPAKESCS